MVELSPLPHPFPAELMADAVAGILREYSTDDRVRILSKAWDLAVRPALETEAERVKLAHLQVPFPGRDVA